MIRSVKAVHMKIGFLICVVCIDYSIVEDSDSITCLDTPLAEMRVQIYIGVTWFTETE